MLEQFLTIFLCCTTFIGPRSGVYENELNYCSPRPNCVSSQSFQYNIIHHIKPFQYQTTKQEAMKQLKNALVNMPNVWIIEENENYIKTRFHTKVFHFIDIVEFLFEEDKPIIQIRSESYLGLFDFFANRLRMEKLRKELGYL